jgi:hypothetical protein
MSTPAPIGGAATHRFTCFLGNGGTIKPAERLPDAGGVRLQFAPGLHRCALQKRHRWRRNGAKAQYRAAAVAMLVRTSLVVISDRGCRPFVRVNGRFSVGVAMLMLVAMLMPVLMSELMSALSEKFSDIFRNWDGHRGRERAKEICDGYKPPQPSPCRPPQATHPVINPITARYITPFRPNANRQGYDKFMVQPLVDFFASRNGPESGFGRLVRAGAAIIPGMRRQIVLRES